MGQGILGAIPVSFSFNKGRWKSDDAEIRNKFLKHVSKDFFDYYIENQKETEKGEKVTYYTIKPEILLPNFKDFFIEFQKLIGNDISTEENRYFEKFDDAYDKAVASGNIDEFLEHFDDHTGYEPTVFSYFDAMYINTNGKDLLIYQGSYKAFLEEWSTLKHMECLLRAAMQHPLAKITRFGMTM